MYTLGGWGNPSPPLVVAIPAIAGTAHAAAASPSPYPYPYPYPNHYPNPYP